MRFVCIFVGIYENYFVFNNFSSFINDPTNIIVDINFILIYMFKLWV